MICKDCGETLTDEEVEYYEYRCDYCERLWSARLTLWRHGKIEEKEFDDIFNVDGNDIEHVPSSDCWCNPELIYDEETGNVWLHRDKH